MTVAWHFVSRQVVHVFELPFLVVLLTFRAGSAHSKGTQIIPFAVRWYTGEAAPDDEYDDEDGFHEAVLAGKDTDVVTTHSQGRGGRGGRRGRGARGGGHEENSEQTPSKTCGPFRGVCRRKQAEKDRRRRQSGTRFLAEHQSFGAERSIVNLTRVSGRPSGMQAAVSCDQCSGAS